MHYPPSKPGAMPANASHAPGPYMSTDEEMIFEQAIGILSAIWTPDVRMWKYHGSQLGDNPRQWPPRLICALAVLAQTAGPAGRVRAMQAISAAMGSLAYTAPTPEHVARATELLKTRAREEQSARESRRRTEPHGRGQHGGGDHRQGDAAREAAFAQDEAVPTRSAGGAALAEQVARVAVVEGKLKEERRQHEEDVAGLRATIEKLKTETDVKVKETETKLKVMEAKLKIMEATLEKKDKEIQEKNKQLEEKSRRVDEAEMKWFDMDANISVISSDRDMFEMYWDTAEMEKKRLEKENIGLKKKLAEKDEYIKTLTVQRDQDLHMKD
ncbi:uncharacterized protein BKCO1_3000238 [Diplodia corticola]|uniref:Uncharacterized protein n=1 Tax=Diplodia corticola TaxID=236234 RepID=A0A1J9SGV7_9PEZI|nr:uncharacterized protein BKCO1_3000238 [Diplodia corticola]OJD39028.1 hypothetical protein BKCO1_3000238 [Diplodia corticola]